MASRWDLNKISEAFVDAAIDPSRWNASMETVVALTGGFGAILLPFKGRLPGIPHSQSLLPALDVYLRDGWSQRDERERGRPIFDQRGVISEFDFTTLDEIKRSAYYQEFLNPVGLRWFAGVRVASGDDIWCLSVQKTIQQGPFSKPELDMFAELSPRLNSAASMARMLGLARADVALESFQISGSAAVLIDRLGCVFRANAAAERMIGAELQIRGRRLVWRDKKATVLLQQMIHHLLWGSHISGSAPPVVLPRENGRPIIAYPIRLTSLAQDALAPARAAVILVDLAQRTVPAADIMRSVFALTPAEAKLAVKLSDGESLSAAAEALGISYETARNQLKAIFAKTQTSRQGEMIALTSRLLLPSKAFSTHLGHAPILSCDK